MKILKQITNAVLIILALKTLFLGTEEEHKNEQFKYIQQILINKNNQNLKFSEYIIHSLIDTEIQ